ncbi:MAG: PQQ-dependent sugar dehydrogenase [Anaerolineae bacterium]
MQPSKSVSLTLLMPLLAITIACNPLGGAAPEPPLPTVVQVTPTFTAEAAAAAPTPQPTAAPTEPASPTDTPAPAPTQAEPEPETEPAAPEPDPTATASPTTPPPPPTDTPAPVVEAALPLSQVAVGIQPVATGFDQPLYVTHSGDGSGRLFVVEQPGRIKVIDNGQPLAEPFLDITDIVGNSGNEQGLLSVAFHPAYESNRYFYVNYTNNQGDTVIARYSATDDPNRADPNSAKVLLTIGQPYGNHNGGHILFGPDGYLYVGMGDGGAGGDPENRAQNLGTLLGKILRLDVDNADPYGAPPDNPFVGAADARPEIWSYGWRNPWRVAFDPANGDFYAADVGQNQYEEVHVEPAGAPGGLNYGWRLMEGTHCYNPDSCDPAAQNLVLPVAEYSHSEGCSVTGGYVYRGAQYPALDGIYFYGDYCSGTVWGLRRQPDGQWQQARLLDSGAQISSFGQDEAGEVYLVDQTGTIYQLGQ